MAITTKSKAQHFFYQTSAGAVSLDVVVGEGNPGALAVFLADAQIAAGPEVHGLALGDGPSLVGKELHILATVRDANPVTNRSSVVAHLHDAATGKTRELSLGDTSADGDVYALTMIVSFA